MKYAIFIVLAGVLALGACKKHDTPQVEQRPIEVPLNQPVEPPPPPKVEKKVEPRAEKKKGTPRLDALERRIKAVEDKIRFYENQYAR